MVLNVAARPIVLRNIMFVPQITIIFVIFLASKFRVMSLQETVRVIISSQNTFLQQ